MKLKWTSLLLASGIVLAACGNDDAEDKDTKDAKNKTEQTKDESSNKATQNTIKWDDVKVSPEDAVKAAQKDSKGDLKDLSFEKETGKWSYKVELLDGKKENKVLIDANTKKVINVENETQDSDDNDKSFKLSDAAKFEEVLKSAQKEAKGDLKEWSLSEENGSLVYSVELKDGNKPSTEFKIDAKNKNILEQEQD